MFILHSLPSDVIRSVINAAPIASVPNMRLIAQRWNTLCKEHSRPRKYFPSIEVVSWNFASYYAGKIELKMIIDDTFVDYFGLANRCIPSLIIQFSHCYMEFASKLLYVDNNEQHRTINQISLLFGRCSRMKTLNLSLDCKLLISDIRVILSAMAGLIIDDVAISGHRSVTAALPNSLLLHFIRSNTINCLTLSIDDIDRDSQGSSPLFLYEISQLVGHVKLVAANPVSDWTVRTAWYSSAVALNRSGHVSASFAVKTLENGQWSIRIDIRKKDDET